MALAMAGNFETAQGITVSGIYWRWAGLGIDVPANQATLVLLAYVNKAAYEAKKSPIFEKKVNVAGMDFLQLATVLETGHDGISAVIYNHLLQTADFAGATEVE